MDNVILRTTFAYIWKCLILYSVYILLRGHNDPGGGFIGGLLLALGIILRGYIAQSHPIEAHLIRRVSTLLGYVLALYMSIIWFPALFGQVVLKGVWTNIWMPIAGKFSSVLLFDVAVYLIVAASAIYAHSVLTGTAQEGSTS